MSKPITFNISDTLKIASQEPPSSVDTDLVQEALEPSVYLLASVIRKIANERDRLEKDYNALSEKYYELTISYDNLLKKIP